MTNPLHPADRNPDDAARRDRSDSDRDATLERDALLTAYALGELDATDRAAVEHKLTEPASDEARRAVSETQRLAAALRAARRDEASAAAPDVRRAVIAALAGSAPTSSSATAATPIGEASPSPTTKPRRRTAWLALPGALAAALVVGIVALRTVDTVESRHDAARSRLVVPTPPPGAGMTNRAETRLARATGSVEKQSAALEATVSGDAGGLPANGGLGGATAPPGDLQMGGRTAPLASQLERVDRLALGAPVEPLPTAAPTDLAASVPPARDLELGRQLAERERLRGVPSAPAAPHPGAPQRRTVEGLLREQRVDEDALPQDSFFVLQDDSRAAGQRDRERYAHIEENRFRAAADAPLSTFSIDVDTASYALVRRFLSSGRRPPPDAVRLEELLNYFSYDDPAPAGADPFSVTVEAATCPWRPGHRLVRIGLRGRDVPRSERPAGNLVFLVDVSGSMRDDDKLPLVKQGLTMLVEELDDNDRVTIVTYAGAAGLRLPPTSGADKAAIIAAIESLTSGGGTHGSAGIELAYAQAAEHFVPGGVNRVILATDGDLNVGITDDRALVELITAKAAGGTFLTVLGVGRGNLQDEKLEKLAAHGNGIYAYLDSAREARKVLVEQLTGSTITIAKDVKIQVEFNPAVVESWRLLGYENRVMAARDFRDDTKDAGDIGAGHAVTALYEVALVGEADDQSGGEPLRYRPRGEPAAAEPVAPASTELLTVKLRFKRPDGDTSVLREVPLAARGGAFAEASADLRFAASVAAFGMLLRGSDHVGDATFGWVAATAAKALGTDPGGWRTEFLDLVRRAESLGSKR